MAKKNNDPFAEFAEKMVNAPKVSDVEVPVQEEDKAPEKKSEVSPSPAPSVPKKKKTTAYKEGHTAYMFYMRDDLLEKVKLASFKNDITAKTILNQALEEYFEKHKGLL